MVVHDPVANSRDALIRYLHQNDRRVSYNDQIVPGHAGAPPKVHVLTDRDEWVGHAGSGTDDGRAPEQLRSLYRVLCACDDALGDNKWVAHREAMPGHTACPGRHLHAHLKEMRGPKWGAKVPRPADYV